MLSPVSVCQTVGSSASWVIFFRDTKTARDDFQSSNFGRFGLCSLLGSGTGKVAVKGKLPLALPLVTLSIKKAGSVSVFKGQSLTSHLFHRTLLFCK